MNPVSPLTASVAPPRDASSPEEAARQFESLLVRQFVEVMTKDLFDTEAESMLTGQADLQRDTLTDTLTEHLVESGTFGVAELMIQQWKDAGRIPAEALATQGRPPFIDNPSDTQP
ncbi:MAG: peptidoglycan hydrolase [Bacteroidota bacterium]